MAWYLWWSWSTCLPTEVVHEDMVGHKSSGCSERMRNCGTQLTMHYYGRPTEAPISSVQCAHGSYVFTSNITTAPWKYSIFQISSADLNGIAKFVTQTFHFSLASDAPTTPPLGVPNPSHRIPLRSEYLKLPLIALPVAL